MNNPNTKSDNWAAKNTKNTLVVFYWTLAWILTTALVKFGTEYIWQSNKLFTGLVILFNVIIGFGMVLAVKRYLWGWMKCSRKSKWMPWHSPWVWVLL